MTTTTPSMQQAQQAPTGPSRDLLETPSVRWLPGIAPPIAHAAVAMLALVLPAIARADALSPSLDWLLPQRVYGSSQLLPGERWEGHLSGERNVALKPGIEWQTSTELSRVRYEQMMPVRAQGFGLSTGPQFRLGAAELSLPWSAGRDTHSVGGGSTWSGGAPRMTVALGPNDRIRLEARISRRKDAGSTKRKRTTSLSWRHSFGDAWSMSAGLREMRETDEADASITGETWASVDARLYDGWRWSLASSLSEARTGSASAASGLQPAQRIASFSLSTRYRLSDGWWISGELKSAHTSYVNEQRQTISRSGGLKLYRDF